MMSEGNDAQSKELLDESSNSLMDCEKSDRSSFFDPPIDNNVTRFGGFSNSVLQMKLNNQMIQN